MNEWEWEKEWRYSGCPDIGDYIQLRATCLLGGCKRQFEGFVLSIEDSIVTIVGMVHRCPFKAVCWRKRIVPMKDDIRDEKQKELEDA